MVKVLIIDDEDILRIRLKKLLDLEGYETFVAVDGYEGIELFKQRKPEIIVLDIKMPGMNGLEVLKEVKSLDKNVEVIIVTGQGTIDTAIQAIREGAFDYIEKPIVYDELVRDIKRIIEKCTIQHRLNQTLEQLNVKNFAIASSINAIIFFNLEEQITYGNAAFLRMWNFTDESAILNQPLHTLWQNTDEIHGILECLKDSGCYQGEHQAVRSDRSIFIAQISANAIRDEHQQTLSHMISCIDITEKKKIEEKLRVSLSEKEWLMKEVHHRVKNNLFIISSLLNLQADYIEDANFRSLLSDCTDRINTMSLIHEKMYDTPKFLEVEMEKYLYDLTSRLFKTYNPSSSIKLEMNIQEISLNIDLVVPCALIINELVTNALKHAFRKDDSGIISISFYKNIDATYGLIVADNGIGIPEEINIHQSKSFGLQLIQKLTQQINGLLELIRNNGTKFVITFREK